MSLTIHIPSRPKGQQSRALDAAIRQAAECLGISPGMAAMVTSHIFEQIARQIADGQAVRVRGFGMFGSRRFHPQGDPHGIAVPTFAPARGLRQEIRSSVRVSSTAAHDTDAALRAYRKRNRSGSIPGRVAQRTWVSQDLERRRILRENFGSIEMD